ncbi:NAD-dependent DNA ligase LigA [Deinococcus soli (ex Cha et al. 2016)]|uniref:DNA ligase n=2 Tax=Deinococcus soli (ex Cha et al. 2016) TaxID=1309411 RepID=A0AAE3XDC3_9DEIO|nr:NAD-dependent DNA ligase LigA [Deinococcus soli (ex Cha et al. 2016)]MDR6218417.1 DNA ligase (NAD+) [Deinococcus soli (ex Cha et al. 2016)]MDR6329157.1 DNA ligase (NAD+) [Deinococcus soli (ex Cha et al. 2016)]MDR6751430.1 DNA ligase (NAD+) [Deinococcus soli (ex Cha et al. 2016)]
MTDTLSPTDRHQQLTRELQYHADLYYNQDAPELTDEQYDALMQELRALEAQHPELTTPTSPTQVIGGRAGGTFEKVRHPTPMTSLDNAFSAEQLADFDGRLRRALELPTDAPALPYTCELKVDGLSVNLYYVDGVLQWAATRGDGEIGEIVTANARTLLTPFPETLPGLTGELEVRGEIYMSKADFAAYNAQADADGRPLLKNPRNGAAGGLRQKHAEEARARRLSAVFYALGKRDGVPVQTQWEILGWLDSQGFPTALHLSREVATPEEAAAYHAEIEANRAALPFDVDGTVIKLNSLAQQQAAGFTSRFPRWATAFKFVAEQVETQLEGITVNTGRTGKLAPRATLRPVLLEGSTVTYATLHNEDFIRNLDLRVGDTVILQKAGGVIPEIVRVVLDRRPDGAQPYAFPTHCPDCGHPTERLDGDANTYCLNSQCPSQQFERVRYFASRDVMDLRGMGDAVIEALLREGLIRDAADLYTLSVNDLADLKLAETDGKVRKLGSKNAQKLHGEIQASTTTELWRVIRALGIKHVSEGGSTRFAKAFGTLDAFLTATREQLESVPDVGPTTASSVLDTLATPDMQHFITRLKAAGLNPVNTDAKVGDQLSGLSFVITGTLSKGRDDIKAHLENHGGKVSGSISKKTSYLIAGDGGGSKLDKATSLGVPVLDEAALTEMLAARGVSAP